MNSTVPARLHWGLGEKKARRENFLQLQSLVDLGRISHPYAELKKRERSLTSTLHSLQETEEVKEPVSTGERIRINRQTRIHTWH